eukprot:1490121-Amphidinium_carterae.1
MKLTSRCTICVIGKQRQRSALRFKSSEYLCLRHVAWQVGIVILVLLEVQTINKELHETKSALQAAQ